MKNSDVLANFKTLCEIPHCSFETQQLREFLVDFARSKGADVRTDGIGNVHAIKGSPSVCLQAHYDMVCVGAAPHLELVEKDGILSAKNSTLGADNGMGVAIAMQMLGEFDDIECLFTNDEEVGMIGAGGFAGGIRSKYLLNLDSEDDNEVIIGCAGGINIYANISANRVKCASKPLYEVELKGLAGGHSGVEIHKDIPNAIKVLAKFLRKNGCELVKFEGGERSNSIPSSARAHVLCQNELKSDNELISVKRLGEGSEAMQNGDKILAFINSFAQGVRAYNKELALVQNSINLSMINEQNGDVVFEFFPRAMSEDGLASLEFETCEMAHALGFTTRVCERSKAWKPNIDEFAKLAHSELVKFRPNAHITAIHAGLECGVLIDKMPYLKACSIGPNIHSPHSTHESCELVSVDLITDVVRNIITKAQDL